jgi:endonuclease/exonuclease/phosphatase family metal-dependent hydrolase
MLDLEPRVLLCGTATPPDAPSLRLCVTHLTNGSATPDAPTIRRRQAEAIAALLGPTAAADRVILAGDLNEVPGRAAVGLLSSILVDSWAAVGVGGGATIPSDAPTARFDYILHGAGLGPTVSAEVPVTTVSDHRPVVVDLTR